MMSLSSAAKLLDAPMYGEDHYFSSVSTDTRTLQPEALFVALQGPNFDGHKFLATAQEKGAAGAIVSDLGEASLTKILVQDSRKALGDLAAAWRRERSTQLVGVTGSNGKTTVKEMIAAILAQSASVLATRGNLNNDIGLPLTLLGLRDEPFVVLEMGANHPGEIAYLSRIAQPDVALITNAGAAHLEGFGDLDGVARAKGEIFSGLAEGGVAILNGDDPCLPTWRELSKNHQTVTFGFSPDADVRLDPAGVDEQWTECGFQSVFEVQSSLGSFPVKLLLAGSHNLRNALAAVAVGLTLKISVADIQQGLGSIRPVPGRLQTRVSVSGLCVIDDSYNANPDSVAAAIGVLTKAPGKRWLVLGDLAELGGDAKSLHAEIGAKAKAAGIDRLWAVGLLSQASVESFGEGARHFESQQALVSELKASLTTRDTVLVKGSRSAGMEWVVAALLEEVR